MSAQFNGGHAREAIRQAAVSLIQNRTEADARVFGNRRPFLNCGRFPCIRISTPLERVKQVLAENPLVLRRELTLRIEIKTRSSNTSQDQLDIISRTIEGLLSEDEELQHGCAITFDTAEPSSASIGRHCFDTLVLEFRCEYDTEAPEPQHIDRLITVHADWHLDQDGDTDAEDTETLPQ
ncbi:hypothetical protein [Endozoicomonas acroporae]|uniref:hypothetical protein n=1 Tax=Endozoicomonas acroporae TaxID=1701104 RepID=UPI0013D88EE5|nr:hypothetical protein [Endozoicomonas acroporae]